MTEIIDFLVASKKPGRSEIASFLLNADGGHREAIARTIDQQLRDNRTLGRPRPVSTYGQLAFTLMTGRPRCPATRSWH